MATGGSDTVVDLIGAVLSYTASDDAFSLALARDFAAAIAAKPADAPRPIADGSRARPDTRDLTDTPPAVPTRVGADETSAGAAGGSIGGGGGGAITLGSKIFVADFCLGFESSSSSSSLGQSSLAFRLGFLLLTGEEKTDDVGGTTGAEIDAEIGAGAGAEIGAGAGAGGG